MILLKTTGIRCVKMYNSNVAFLRCYRTKYNINDKIVNIGMYLRPLFISPFSTIATINDEKRDITKIASNENLLKSSGFTAVVENAKGMLDELVDETASLLINLRVIFSNCSESAKSSGLIIITITEIEIM